MNDVLNILRPNLFYISMENLDWQAIFLNDLSIKFALEIFIRTFIMFTMLIVFLRSTGKKGVRQLSIFEVAIIIALGSAAGDPMLNKESAVLPSLLVFVSVLGLYRLITYLAIKSEKMEMILEGEPMYIIEDGQFVLGQDGDSNFAKDEFFAEMRNQNIEHLGQVRTALLETNGQVSFCFYLENQVKAGMPIYPKIYNKKSRHISVEGSYACTHCANVVSMKIAQPCPRCFKEEWVATINTPRIT